MIELEDSDNESQQQPGNGPAGQDSQQSVVGPKKQNDAFNQRQDIYKIYADLEEPPDPDDPTRPFVCPMICCKMAYATEDELTMHRAEHPGADGTPYQCPKCEVLETKKKWRQSYGKYNPSSSALSSKSPR